MTSLQDNELQNYKLPSSAAEIVRSLLLRHNVDKRRFVVAVAEALNLSRTAAYQRVNGGSGWLWDDLIKIGSFYNENILTMVQGAMGTTHPAQLIVQKHKAHVMVRLGEGSVDRSDLWAAFRNNEGRLTVMQTNQVPYSFRTIKVVELIHIQNNQTPTRVAVLEDSPQAASEIAQMLTAEGCNTKAFSTPESLVEDLQNGREFDAFVVDWSLCNQTAEDVIGQLRKFSTDARIIILAGEESTSSKISNDALLLAQRRYHFFVNQKPITAGVLMANLTIDL